MIIPKQTIVTISLKLFYLPLSLHLFIKLRVFFSPKSVWPDLAKFHQVVNIFKVLGNCLRVNLLFGKLLIPIWIFSMLLGTFSLWHMGKYLKNNIDIWSHCPKCILPMQKYHCECVRAWADTTLHLNLFDLDWRRRRRRLHWNLTRVEPSL